MELQTVTGIMKGTRVTKALAHEHMFVDFHATTDANYMDVNWSNKIGAAVESASQLASQGVNLVIEWTNLGIGRNVLALRSVSNQSGISFVCPTGIYKDFLPPALTGLSSKRLADHFISELASGIDGTAIRAGFIKTAANENGIRESERTILRAAAMAGKETGAAIGFHGPRATTTFDAIKLFDKAGFEMDRLVWAHAQVCSLSDNLVLANRGAMLQYDAIGTHGDDGWGGSVDDESMLKRIEDMIAAGFEDQVMLSTDASVCINPPGMQYDRHNSYLYRYFEDKLTDRIGQRRTRKVLRNNVISSFRRPTQLS